MTDPTAALREAAERAGWWIVANAGPQDWWPATWRVERQELLDSIDKALANTAQAAADHDRQVIERVLTVIRATPIHEVYLASDGHNAVRFLNTDEYAEKVARALLAEPMEDR